MTNAYRQIWVIRQEALFSNLYPNFKNGRMGNSFWFTQEKDLCWGGLGVRMRILIYFQKEKWEKDARPFFRWASPLGNYPFLYEKALFGSLRSDVTTPQPSISIKLSDSEKRWYPFSSVTSYSWPSFLEYQWLRWPINRSSWTSFYKESC